MNYTKEYYLSYVGKCFEQLEQLRLPSGVFRASDSEEYNATWIRDNYYCAMAYYESKRYNKYLETVHTHIDFLLQWEKDYQKLDWIIKEPVFNSENAYRFIQPKVNFDGTEIKGLKWQFLQADTLAYLLMMVIHAEKTGISCIRSQDDYDIIQKLIRAMEAIKIYEQPFAHAWEEEVGIFLSNLGLYLYSLQEAEAYFEIDREHLRKLRRKFYGQLPYERTGRDYDLTQLFICILPNFLHEIDKKDLLQGVRTNLSKMFGVWRYKDDFYKPFREYEPKEPMQWLMGNSFLSLIYNSLDSRDGAYYYANKNCTMFPDGDIPEGVDENGKPCFNRVLAWSISMQIQALFDIIEKK